MTVVENCQLRRIAINPNNVRRDLGDLSDLVASISELGILEPLIVAPRSKDDPDYDKDQPFVLIAGHRRLAAATKAGVEKSTVVVRDDLLTVPAQLQAMLVENLHRADITPAEEAAAYAQLVAFDVKPTEIAKRTGRSVATIRDRVKVAKLPEVILDKLHNRALTLDDAVAMTEFLGDKTAMETLTKAASGSMLRYTLDDMRRAKQREKKVAAAKKAVVAGGARLIDEPKGWPYSSLEKRIDRVGLTVADHKTCPGHAGFVDRWGEITLVCTDPVTHHPQPDTDDGDDLPGGLSSALRGLTPEQEAEREERDRIRAVLEQAAQARREFTGGFVDGTRPAPAGALGMYLANALVWDGDQEAVAAELGWTAPDFSSGDEESDAVVYNGEEYADGQEAFDAWFYDQMTSADQATLDRVVMRLVVATGEGELPSYSRHWLSSTARAYARLLTTAGYELTPEEQAKLRPVPATTD